MKRAYADRYLLTFARFWLSVQLVDVWNRTSRLVLNFLYARVNVRKQFYRYRPQPIPTTVVKMADRRIQTMTTGH